MKSGIYGNRKHGELEREECKNKRSPPVFPAGIKAKVWAICNKNNKPDTVLSHIYGI